MINRSRAELMRLLRNGQLWCACAQAPATEECVEDCHTLLDEHTRKVISSRISWEEL